jgi:hypothetical protein
VQLTSSRAVPPGLGRGPAHLRVQVTLRSD